MDLRCSSLGGAGGQHAAAVAAELGMTTVVAGALQRARAGLLAADVRTTATRTLLCSLETTRRLPRRRSRSWARAAARDAAAGAELVAERWAGLRYADQYEIPMAVAGPLETLPSAS